MDLSRLSSRLSSKLSLSNNGSTRKKSGKGSGVTPVSGGGGEAKGGDEVHIENPMTVTKSASAANGGEVTATQAHESFRDNV